MNQRRVVGLVAAAAVVAAGGTMVVMAWPAGTARTEAQAQARPPAQATETAPTVEEVTGAARPAPKKLKAYDGPAVKAVSRPVPITPDGTARRAAVSRRDTARFSMLSVTWTDPKDAPRGTVEVRTRSAKTGTWSGWQALETEESQGPDQAAEATAKVRGGTGALWVGASDGVDARLSGSTTPLPAGLRLNLIDPGTAKSSGGQGGGAEVAPSTSPAPAAVPAVPFPSYVSRAGWGADESLTRGTPAYAASVKVQFVHHTAGANTYECAQSPELLRGILVDHTQNRGWDDVGYNFLVDKCGTLFEGRRGGVDKPVIGAHTYGFNTLSSGIAVLGNYVSIPAPAEVRSTVAQVAAAKLGQYGLAPIGTSELTEGVADGKFPLGTVVTFQRISGHRDGVNTECPGNALYAQLPAIRQAAGATPAGLTASAPTGGVQSGSTYYVKGAATLAWTVETPSDLLARFEILVDGKVAGSLPGTARAGTVKSLASGTRKLQVRAVHLLGGTATTPAATVYSDITKPVFTSGALLNFRGGTVSTTSMPVFVKWQASDNVKLASVYATSPSKTTFAATATTWPLTAKPSVYTLFTVAAKDPVGNVGTSSISRAPVLVQETSASRSGTWKTATSTNHLHGKALTSTARNAKLTWTFTGRAVALIVGRGTTAGAIDVYLDGRRLSTVDLKSTSAQYRQLIWTRTFGGEGRHTIQVVNRATSGRPSVTVDGISYLR